MARLSARAQSNPPADDARARRRSQWDALRGLWTQSSLDRVRKCRRVVCDHAVSLSMHEGRAGYGGLVTCGSVWSCPRCSAGIWARRADELDAAVREWDAQGGKVAMVTLTMRHSPKERLQDLWDGLSAAWAAASGNYRGARQAIDAAGGAGWVRVVEATHGANGWHLHVHALMLVAADADVDQLGTAMFAAWRDRLAAGVLQSRTIVQTSGGPRIAEGPRNRRSFGVPIAGSGGLDVRTMDLSDSASEVARYVAKATYEATRAVAAELAPAGKRAGRGNRRPFDVLADLLAESGDVVRDAGIWAEWERASAGRRALTWKQGTRDLLGLGDELADDELSEDLDVDPAELQLIARIVKPDWAALCAIPGAPALLLDVAEDAPQETAGQAVAACLAGLLGRPPRDYANSCGSGALDAPERRDDPRLVDVLGGLLDLVTGELLQFDRAGPPRMVVEWAIEAHREAPHVSTSPAGELIDTVGPFGLAVDR